MYGRIRSKGSPTSSSMWFWMSHSIAFFFQAEDGIRDADVTGVQTCALPIWLDQILFMRPVAGWGGHATPIAGLYLGGAGSHPGPGVLGGAGWLASRRILADRKR